MKVRNEIDKALDSLSDEALNAVLDYVQFIQEPEEVEPTEEESRAIAKGREEFARGEYVKWREIKNNAL